MAIRRNKPDPPGADRDHQCRIFNCDYRRGSFCCSYCWRRKECRNPCHNIPERCGECYTAEKTGGEQSGEMDNGGA